MPEVQTLLAASAARHSHLCPRQVLGVRAGLAAGAFLGLDLPRHDKRLLVILETDGCFADGIEVATGATVGHRTLRIEDYGKTAATFVDTHTGRAVRLIPAPGVRQAAHSYAPLADSLYTAQLHGYQSMPDAELFAITEVLLDPPLEAILSQHGLKAICAECGEEIINQREVLRAGRTLCRSCAGQAYYTPAPKPIVSKKV